MADNTIQQILDDAVLIAPVWDEDTWSALQSGRFDEAGSHIASILSKFTPEEWGYVNWEGIVIGAPSLRGSIEIKNWMSRALPQIGAAIMRSASPSALSKALSSLSEENLPSFRQLINDGLLGTTPEEKMQGLKKSNVNLFNFIAGSPLGISPLSPLTSLQKGNLKRLGNIPQNLKLLMFSVQTPEIIRKIAEQNNIPTEKIPAIAQAVGLALLGFIHPEDLTEEISKTGIASQAAAAVSKDLGIKVFSAVKQDIDKTYAPLAHDVAVQAPKILSEITAPKIISQTASGAASLSAIPLGMNQPKPVAAPAPVAPKKLPEAGWSRSTQNEPVIRLSQPSPTMPQPASAERAVPPPQVRQMPSELNASLGEFERIAMRQKEQKNVLPPLPNSSMAANPSSMPKPPTPAPEAAPMIIHEDTVFKAKTQAPDFRLQMPTETFGSMKKDTMSVPTKDAVLELGRSGVSLPPKPTMTSTPRVVHYTEHKGPSSQAPAASQGPRQITEITMPIPPPPPAPQNKVVYKDYSAPLTPPPPPQK